MVGSSQPMREIFDRVTRIAGSRGTTVLITGESGTGKELVARAVHFLSERRDQPLMTVNCSALSETLIESELFGHEKGAFTDARNQKKGIFEVADGGTIFFDEIGDISPKVQAKLLRVLEHQTFQRVGGTVDIHIDVRIIAATNVDLEAQVGSGLFRADLFYRLNVAHIHLPPLRTRGDDVVELAAYYITEFNAQFRKHFKGLTEETQRMFKASRWPGNVRELRNVLERATLLGDGEWIQPGDIEFARLRGPSGILHSHGEEVPHAGMSLDEVERVALMDALERSGNNQSEAARILKITRDTLRYRMKKHGLTGRHGDAPS
jgi:two-component system response regulator AtoC